MIVAGAKMIDWTKVEELRDELGPQGMEEVVDLFLDEVEGALRLLGRPDRRPGPDLHFIKGCAANLGFTELARLCAEQEGMTHAGAPCDAVAVDTCYRLSKSLFLAGKGRIAGPSAPDSAGLTA